SGRVDDFAVLESNPSVFYVGAATGGVWKTTNNGTTFTPVFDNETTASIGDVAIAPTDANLVWVGTGENNNRQSSSWGDGVFKSTDGGKTWRNMGLRGSTAIARIIVDPVDFNVVYVASLGNLWGGGGDRGVYKTTDGGQTWQRTLFVNDDTGATELVMDPSNNKVLYAATYQRRRAQWGMNGGGPGSGIWKSSDAGQTWTKLETGLPAGPKGRIGIDIWRANPNVLYARVEHETESGLYRSDDAGASWRKMNNTNPRPMYFSQVRIDPKTDSRIYVLGVSLYISDDAGKTFRDDGARNIHVDHHAMWIDPNNPDHLMIGNDGGASMSFDRAATWVWMNNLPFAQAYHVTYDMQTPYHVCAGLQDNNTWCGPSAVRTNTGITNDDWYVITGGDGFQPLQDPSDARILYGESQDGRMSRVDRITNERKTVRPEPPAGEPALRWNWDTAMHLSPHDPATVYVGANRLFKSTDRGHSWKAISGDLTTNTNRNRLAIMNVGDEDIKIAKHDGVGSFGNLVTIAESPAKAGILWTGSDDGVVSVSRDGGITWTNATAKIAGVPKWTYVSKVAPSRFADGTAYVAFDGHRGGDFNTYAFVTTDFGNSWHSIAGNLPKGEVVRTITEDVKDGDVLYVGTETSLWVSTNRGKQWTRIKANLPTVPIYEITLHPRENDMILATHGRALWILDDLTPFQQWAKAESAGTFAFDPAPAVAFNQANDQMKEFEGDRVFLGKNPDRGVSLFYRLATDAKEVKWTVRDGSNAVVRELSGDATKDRNRAGVNSVLWDLRHQALRPLRNPPQVQQGGGGGGFGGGGNNGPFVLPGTYRATLTVDGRDANTVNVTVTGDPAIQISDADRKTWHDTAMAIHQLQEKANAVADEVGDAWTRFQAIEQQARGQTLAPALKTELENVRKELEGMRRRLGLAGGGGFGGGGGEFGANQNIRGRMGQLKGGIMSSTSLPTEVQMRQKQEIEAEWPKVAAEANAALAKLPALAKDVVNAVFGKPTSR
ncbi:MAG TPA: hypothetical protein VEK56_11615, partial [Vicinamibacterales bacterium]|nr:hypothetical protein [Vicinamibacterales bacterium]